MVKQLILLFILSFAGCFKDAPENENPQLELAREFSEGLNDILPNFSFTGNEPISNAKTPPSLRSRRIKWYPELTNDFEANCRLINSDCFNFEWKLKSAYHFSMIIHVFHDFFELRFVAADFFAAHTPPLVLQELHDTCGTIRRGHCRSSQQSSSVPSC